MNRRGFLKGLIGATGAAVVAPELLIPEKRFWQLDQTMSGVLPTRYHWMGSLQMIPLDEVEWFHDGEPVNILGARSMEFSVEPIVPHRYFTENKHTAYVRDQLAEQRAKQMHESIQRLLEGWRNG